MDKLLLVDGHNLLFRMFFGMPARISGKDGKAVQAVIGFTGALLRVIAAIRPTHVCVLFDSENGSFRNEADPAYKSNRPDYTDIPEEENPFTQLDGIRRCLDHLGIRHFESACGFEADDIIAAYAMKAGMDTVILSNDKDFFQLVNHRVSVYIYNGKNSLVYDEETVAQRYGVAPACFADYLSLVGDAADNVKGVPMIGPKTAKKLLDAYGGIDGILENMDAVAPDSLKRRLKEHRDTLLHNRKMIRLDGEAPLPCCVEDLLAPVDPDAKTMQILKAAGQL